MARSESAPTHPASCSLHCTASLQAGPARPECICTSPPHCMRCRRARRGSPVPTTLPWKPSQPSGWSQPTPCSQRSWACTSRWVGGCQAGRLPVGVPLAGRRRSASPATLLLAVLAACCLLRPAMLAGNQVKPHAQTCPRHPPPATRPPAECRQQGLQQVGALCRTGLWGVAGAAGSASACVSASASAWACRWHCHCRCR